MFNKDFYPTPPEVIAQMSIDCRGKVVLEPSAGKGDLVEWLTANGAKQVLVCEKHPDLAKVVHTKGRFLMHDFLQLQAEEISHVELIVMNPPFSADEHHILHAWNIAPAGCEIIALCNWETYDHAWSGKQRELKHTVEEYGHATNLGNCFSAAERQTWIEIGLLKLYKPGAGSNEFAGFFMDEEPEELAGPGIMRFDAIRDVVQRYINAVRCFEEHLRIAERMNELTKPFDVGTFSFEISSRDSVCTKEDFKKALQKKAWAYLFRQLNLQKYVTSGVMKDINKFVEQQQNVPFTMANVYRMFQIIAGTFEENMKRALVEAVDKFTMHTHANRFGVEGWKTNAGHLLNRKVIVDAVFEHRFGGGLSPRISMYSNTDKIEDLIKVLCRLTGTRYEDTISLDKYCRDNTVRANEWHDWNFFEFKAFGKGTMHLKFKSEQTWALLNQQYAKIKGAVLPEKFYSRKANSN